jgi:hypothetical protein
MPFINRIGSGATRKFGFGAGMKPGAPTGVVGTPGNLQVSVAFTPSATPGTGIATYTATSSPGGFTASGSGSPLVVTGLTNGTAYTFTVTATNSFGSSTSDPSAPVTPATVPSTPGAPTATRGDTQVSLSWTAPSNGGSAITDYVVQYSSDSGSNWTTFADGTSATTSAIVTGLTNGTSHVFRIAATNAVGTSSYSSASSAVTPAGVPATPAAPTPTAGNGQVSLSWTAPSNNGSAITDYLVYYSTSVSGTYTIFSDGVSTSTSATVTGLTNGTAYYFKIRAVNDVGNSDFSAASTSATPAPPPPPPPPPCFCASQPWPNNCSFVGYTCDGQMRYDYYDCGCSQTCPGTGGYNGQYVDGYCGYTAPPAVSTCDACGGPGTVGECYDFGFGLFCYTS